jgi:hypothetical protein
MNVAALQRHLSDLTEFLSQAGATSKVLDGLKAVHAGLEPFAEYEFNDFATFLKHADEYKRAGVIPIQPSKKKSGSTAPKAPKPKAQTITLDESRMRVRTLYEMASTGEVSRQRLDEEFAPFLARGGLTLDDLKLVAAEADSAGTVRGLKTKPKVVDAIKQAILKRSGNVERIGQ